MYIKGELEESRSTYDVKIIFAHLLISQRNDSGEENLLYSGGYSNEPGAKTWTDDHSRGHGPQHHFQLWKWFLESALNTKLPYSLRYFGRKS